MSKKVKILADDKIPFLKGALEPFADVEYYPGAKISNEHLMNADALIIRTRTKCNEDLLEDTNVKIITTATIGFDHIDTGYCKEKGILWYNAPGCNSSSVQQYIASVLVNMAKKKNFILSDKAIGIIGVGNVGSKVERFAKAIGMKVLLNDPPRARVEGNSSFVSLDELIEQCDIITIHVPLNKGGDDKTFHMADKNFFNKLKNKPIVINSSRGEVIETTSLKYAIKNEIVSGSILDVWENEPNLDLELIDLVDIATPHIAGYSADGKANGTAACVQKLSEYFGFDLPRDWYPNLIPTGERPLSFIIDGKEKTKDEVLFEAINYTYNIFDDDTQLRKDISDFEKQRNEYPVRREFHNYQVQVINADNAITSILDRIGFRIIK